MNDPSEELDNLSEQERLFRARAEASLSTEFCVASDLSLVPDEDPVIPAESCGDEAETLEAEFLPPNPPPPEIAPPDLLPSPLVVSNRAVSRSCASGQVALAGSSPTVVVAGEVTQVVYLDEIPGIAQTELFRLADYISALQAHVSANLNAAIDAADFAAFDDGIVLITKTSATIATAIRSALAAAVSVTEQIAETIALSELVCGWRNVELWVECQPEDPGYAVSFSDPETDGTAYSPAGAFSSLISQDDANTQAARAAALELDCLVMNEEQEVFCSDVPGAVSEILSITWPVNWVKAADARDAALGVEVVTLEQQGAGTWGVSDWDDFESNTESILLGDLNGQEFMQSSQVGSADRRRLRTRAIIEAGDPRAAAVDLETANQIAYNLAAAELDCFVPSRPRIISCVTPTYGSDEVATRHAALELSSDDAGRSAVFDEMLGGNPVVYGGPSYTRTNTGVANYGLPTEREDRTVAFEVYMWPGYLSALSEEAADEAAGNYGAGFLQCVWISPYHGCACVSTPEDSVRESVSSPDQLSSKFSTDTTSAEGVRLNTTGSVAENSIPRGFIVETEYPNRGADPDYNATTLLWPDLPAICQTGLSCLFGACKTVCCEPKPDDRPYLVNGMPNYATWNSNWLTGPARKTAQIAFMNAWNARRVNVRFNGCVGYPDSDDCGISTIPVAGASNSIVAVGPDNGAYGMPARFKYGGILRWGAQWAEAAPINPGAPTNAALDLVGTAKACHKDGEFTQTPDAWGLFHCAEGYAESYTPFGLGEVARQNALARLDCTHISWPRHLSNCSDPSQKGFGPSVNLNVVTEASSTRDANEQLENMLLSLLACRSTGNFALTFRAGGGDSTVLSIAAPAVANVGGRTCHPPGTSSPIVYTDDCTTEADLDDLPANKSSHVFIVVKCCRSLAEEPENPPEKRLILHTVEDPTIDTEIETYGRQAGALGLPSGRAALETLRLTDPDVWYIGSFSVKDLGNGKSSWSAHRSIVQAHTGPLVMSNSCCGSDDLWGLEVVDAEAGEVRISNPGVVKRTTALDASGLITIIDIDADFTAAAGKMLGIEFERSGDATLRMMAESDLDGWPYPMNAIPTTPSGGWLMEKYFYVMWDFVAATADKDAIKIRDNLFAERRGFNNHLQMMLSRQEDKDGHVVSSFILMPSVGCRRS